MIFSKFLDSLDFCFFVSRQRSEKKTKINDEDTFKYAVLEISGYYNYGRLLERGNLYFLVRYDNFINCRWEIG